MWNCLLQLCKECLAKERLYSATKRYIEQHRATEKSWFENPGFFFHTLEVTSLNLVSPNSSTTGSQSRRPVSWAYNFFSCRANGRKERTAG
jgi:hypothetical protein